MTSHTIQRQSAAPNGGYLRTAALHGSQAARHPWVPATSAERCAPGRAASRTGQFRVDACHPSGASLSVLGTRLATRLIRLIEPEDVAVCRSVREARRAGSRTACRSRLWPGFRTRRLPAGPRRGVARKRRERRISDAIYAALVADARRAAAARPESPGGQPGNHSVSRAAGSHPERRLFGQATPGPATTLRPGITEGLAPGQPNGALRRRAKNSLADLKKPATTP